MGIAFSFRHLVHDHHGRNHDSRRGRHGAESLCPHLQAGRETEPGFKPIPSDTFPPTRSHLFKKAIPPNPAQTVTLTGNQAFKQVSL